MRPLLGAIGATLCVAAGTGLASASGSQRSHTLPFSAGWGGHHPPKRAPRLLGARAQVTVPGAWSAVAELTPGTICAREYLLIGPAGDVGRRCEQDEVYAQAGAGPQAPALFPSPFPVLGRGALPTVAGMQGAWKELDVGVAGTYHAYQVVAAYEAANHKLFYELIVVPPSSTSGDCHGRRSQACANALRIARSFRVAVTDPNTAQMFT